MRIPFILPLCATMFLTGCAYMQSVGEMFSADKADAEKLAAETAKVAAENSESPETAVTDFAVKEGSSRLADSLAARLTSDSSKTRVSATSQKNEKSAFTISNVTALGPIDSNAVNFVQSSLYHKPKRSTVNVGLGRRQLSDDETILYGVNAFLDYAPKYGHQRGSIGAEIRGSAFEVTANRYFRLSGWKKGVKNVQERTMNGTEIEIGGQVPYIPSVMLFAKSWEWSGKRKQKGKTYSIDFRDTLGPGLTLTAGVRDYDGSKKSEKFATVRYTLQIGDAPSEGRSQPLISDEAFSSESMRPRLLDEVKRTNQIMVEAAFSTSTGGV